MKDIVDYEDPAATALTDEELAEFLKSVAEMKETKFEEPITKKSPIPKTQDKNQIGGKHGKVSH